jgi:hypothetical protein
MKDMTVGDGPTFEPTNDEMAFAVEKQADEDLQGEEGDDQDPPIGVPLDPKEEDMIVVEDPKEVDQKENGKADKNTDDEEGDDYYDDDEDDDETEAPTFLQTTSPTMGATGSPTLNEYWVPATTEAPIEPLMISDFEVQEAAELTDAPAPKEDGKNKDTDSPTMVVTLSPTIRPTVAPAQVSNAVETPSEEQEVVEEVTTTHEPTPTNSSVETGPYSVRLPPLYYFVTMRGMANEEAFLDVLVAYMTYFMERDFQGFQSVSYGATLYSMITKYPSMSSKSSEGSDEPISNITAHINLLTATFDSRPPYLDWEIKDYMEMLLEDEVRMQEYVIMQVDLDFTILSTSLEYEDTVAPTNIQAPNGATGEGPEEEKERNLGMIIGWTVGAFAVLFWVILLYGIQSRGSR